MEKMKLKVHIKDIKNDIKKDIKNDIKKDIKNEINLTLLSHCLNYFSISYLADGEFA